MLIFNFSVSAESQWRFREKRKGSRGGEIKSFLVSKKANVWGSFLIHEWGSPRFLSCWSFHVLPLILKPLFLLLSSVARLSFQCTTFRFSCLLNRTFVVDHEAISTTLLTSCFVICAIRSFTTTFNAIRKLHVSTLDLVNDRYLTSQINCIEEFIAGNISFKKTQIYILYHNTSLSCLNISKDIKNSCLLDKESIFVSPNGAWI